MAAAATVAAVLALATIGLIAAVPGAVESGFLGWAEFPTVIRLAYHLPLAVALIAALLVALAAIGWARGWWRPGTAPRYVSLTVATVLLVGQLAAWRLIGWGLG